MAGKCKECGAEYIYTRETKLGIETLFEKLKVDSNTKKNIHEIRNGIIHGHRNIDSTFIEKISQINPHMAFFLHYGLELVLDMPYDRKKDGRFDSISPQKIMDLMIFEIDLYERDRNKLGLNGEHPFFLISYNADTLKYTEEGLTGQIKFTKRVGCSIGANCQFKIPGKHSKLTVQVNL